MMRLPERLLGFARPLLPADQADWVEGMSAELSYIEGGYPRLAFAVGCLATAIGVFARTRRGLSVLGRGLVASALILVTFYIMWVTTIWQDPEVARLIMILGLIYCGAGILCVVSIKAMRRYVAVWTVLGGVAFVLMKLMNIGTAELTNRYLSAVTIEFIGMMLALFIASSYLNLLHDPDAEV